MLIPLYDKLKKEQDLEKKIRLVKTIAILRNMTCSATKGAYGRGYNLYIHPDYDRPHEWHFVIWVNKLPNQNLIPIL